MGDLKSKFLKKEGVDLTDFEYAGKFPSKSKKSGQWGNIPRGEGYKRYSEWLEKRVAELEEREYKLLKDHKILFEDATDSARTKLRKAKELEGYKEQARALQDAVNEAVAENERLKDEAEHTKTFVIKPLESKNEGQKRVLLMAMSCIMNNGSKELVEAYEAILR